MNRDEYSDPADIKKLRFILSRVAQYSRVKNKDIGSLCILDVGCKKGVISFPLASLGCKVKGFDIDAGSIRYAQALIEKEKIANLKIMTDNAFTFNDGVTYDIVIISEVLEHVTKPLELVANIAKRMRAGSYCIATVPNGYGPWELKNRINPMTYLRKWNWLRCRVGRAPYIYGTGADHCHFYTKNNLIKTFSKFGFKLIGFRKSHTFLSIFQMLRKNSLIGRIDIALADQLPYWLASGWYFVFELNE